MIMTNTAAYKYDFTARGEPAERKHHSEVSRQQLTRAFCRPLSPVLADLLDIVMAVYAADRRSPRNYQRRTHGTTANRHSCGRSLYTNLERPGDS